MTTTTFVRSAVVRRMFVALALAGAVIVAMIANAAGAAAWAQPDRAHHTGPDYTSITGARTGAPGEQEVSTYGGSHKHLWVEQQLYGPGVVYVPRVDTTVHQSH